MGGTVADVLSNREYREVAVAFAASTSLLLASLANFLNHNDYPLARPEVGLIAAGVLAFAVLMALWYAHSRQWGRSLLEGLLAALFVDLNTESLPVMAAAGLGVAGYTAWRRTSLLGPMVILGIVVLVTTVLGLGGRPVWMDVEKGPDSRRGAAGKPAILHLILDEHLGLEGLAAEGPAGQTVSDELRAFYTGAGFTVYGGAYSQHYHTANSVPYILNYGRGLGRIVDFVGVETGPTEHLRSLVDGGYRLSILQSEYADMCTGARFHECATYDSASLRPTIQVPMTGIDRAELIASKSARLSAMLTFAGSLWNSGAREAPRLGIRPLFFDETKSHSSSVGALEALPALVKRLRSARPGDAFVAHLLFPHHPYAVGRDCRYLPRPWQGLRTAGAADAKRRAYYDQLRCTRLKIAAVLDALSQSRAGRNAIVIIHGDHGSRIAPFDLHGFNRDRFTDADVIAGFSTLFAIRYPGGTAAYVPNARPVAALLGEFARSGFKTAPAPVGPLPPLQLDDRELRITGTMPLPEAWTKRLYRPAGKQ